MAEQLEEDLQLLSDALISEGPLPLSQIRVIAAATRRKWLLDKQLSKLLHSFNVSAELPALDTAPHVKIIDKLGDFGFYTAGGVSIDGRPINSIYVSPRDRPEDGSGLLPVPKMKHFRIGKFLDRKCTYVKGTWLTNRDLLHFMANKAGGVHFDRARDERSAAAIEVARRFLQIGDTPPEEWGDGQEVFLQVGKPTGKPWDCTHIEVLSIAQPLLNIHIDGEPLVYRMDEKNHNKWLPLEKFKGALKRLFN